MKALKQVLLFAGMISLFVIFASCRVDTIDQRHSSSTAANQNSSEAVEFAATTATATPAPLWCPKAWIQSGNVSSYTYDPVLSDNACFYMGQSGESCNTICGHFYGVDATKSALLAKNANKCDAMIKTMNSQQTTNYKLGTANQAPAGVACGWLITGKYPNTAWYTVSGATLNPVTTNSAVSQVCACQVYDYPNYNGLGLTYHSAKGTSGNVNKPMSVIPTYLTGKIADTNPYTNGKYSKETNSTCTVDPKTPLPAGLTLRPTNCEIYGTPTAVLAQPTTYIIYAIDSSYVDSSPLGKSNPAPVTLTISK